MLTAKKSLKQKNSEKSYSWRRIFSIFFASGLFFPPTMMPLTYSAKGTKNPKIQVRLEPLKSCYPRESK
jgi:hypothetical protein